jgi:hypothetical protein
MHNSEFGESPTKSDEVGEKVNSLLNANISSNLFGSIPATKSTVKKSVIPEFQRPLAVAEDKIKISYPVNNSAFNAGDTITIRMQIDTTDCNGYALYFQDQSFFEVPHKSNIEYKLMVSPEYIEGQSISVMASYLINDSSYISTANIDIKVNPVGPIVDFRVKPQVLMIEKTKSRRPEFEAVFSDAISSIGQSDLVTVSIKDTNLVNYDASYMQFDALEVGSTSATVSYRGKSTTVFFEIIQYVEPISDPITGFYDIPEKLKHTNPLRVYPNPSDGLFYLDFGHEQSPDCMVLVYNNMGQKVFQKEYHSDYRIGVDLSGQKSGVYVIEIISEEYRHKEKIFIR